MKSKMLPRTRCLILLFNPDSGWTLTFDLQKIKGQGPKPSTLLLNVKSACNTTACIYTMVLWSSLQMMCVLMLLEIRRFLAEMWHCFFFFNSQDLNSKRSKVHLRDKLAQFHLDDGILKLDFQKLSTCLDVLAGFAGMWREYSQHPHIATNHHLV